MIACVNNSSKIFVGQNWNSKFIYFFISGVIFNTFWELTSFSVQKQAKQTKQTKVMAPDLYAT